MQRLTDFKPLERVVLPDLGQLDCAGLTLLIGPNSSGKTQFLRDLEQRIAGEPRDLVVAQEILVRKPEYKPLLDCLEREEYIKYVRDQNGNVILRPQTTYIGASQGQNDIQPSVAEEWYKAYPHSNTAQNSVRVLFHNYFGRMFMTALFLDRRLATQWAIGSFDRNAQPPQGDLHVLHYNEAAQDDLWTETTQAFSKAVWLDPTKPNSLRLLAADKPFPTDKDRRSAARMDRQRDMTTEGDGLKSYVSTCIALLLGRRPVCLIDEPELCLHPPQAYRLGRFLGTFGVSHERATLVATHSSHILRGVVQTAEQLQIIRLTRESNQFHAHLVQSDTLRESLKKPAVRSETILDGLFADAVVVVEGAGDRTLYQAVWETLGELHRFDIHFAPVGGTSGIFDAVQLYKTLKIPLAVIADLDIIKDVDHLRRVVTALDTKEGAAKIAETTRKIVAKIKTGPPAESPGKVKAELLELAASRMDWEEGDDAELSRRLQQVAGQLNRLDILKKGVAATPPDITSLLTDLIQQAQSIGLFLVPVGELENWSASENITAAKRTKWAWANDAAAQVRRLGPRNGDVWDFMRGIGTQLENSRPQTST